MTYSLSALAPLTKWSADVIEWNECAVVIDCSSVNNSNLAEQTPPGLFLKIVKKRLGRKLATGGLFLENERDRMDIKHGNRIITGGVSSS